MYVVIAIYIRLMRSAQVWGACTTYSVHILTVKGSGDSGDFGESGNSGDSGDFGESGDSGGSGDSGKSGDSG